MKRTLPAPRKPLLRPYRMRFASGAVGISHGAGSSLKHLCIFRDDVEEGDPLFVRLLVTLARSPGKADYAHW